MSKSPVYIGAGSNELAVQEALNLIQDGIDSAAHLVTIANWVHADGTTVAGTDFYSAKEYAQGSTLAAGGSSKNWAQLPTTPTTTAADASAKEWATGVSTHKLDASAKEYATHAQYGTVDGSSEYSAKHYSAQSQDWAAKTTIVRNDADGADVDYSSKQYAVGTPPDGSSKEWATTDTNAIAGGLFSAKQYAANSAASASLAEGYVDTFDDKYLGSHTTAVREVGANVGKDNDGDALDDGALYYDTTLEVMKVWDDTGSAWKQLIPTSSEQTNIDLVVANPLATNIGLVAAIDDKVTEVADIDDKVTTVANITAGDVSKVAVITTGDVSKVAVITTGDVSKVAAITTGDVGKVAAITTGDVSKVAVITTGDVSKVAGITTGDVTKVASITTGDVSKVADITTGDVTKVADIDGNVQTVATNITDVSNFADQYQISNFSPAPTTDGSGVNALVAGDLAFDTTAGQGLKVYSGSAWTGTINTTEGVIVKQEYTANGSTKHYVLAHDQGMEIVYLNGVKLLAGDGTDDNDYFSVTSGSNTDYAGDGNAATHIYFHDAPTNTFVISLVAWGASNNTLAVAPTGGTFSGAVTFNAGLTVAGAWTAASQTCADLGTVTTADINGGTIDGVTSFNGTEIVTETSNNLGVGFMTLKMWTSGIQNSSFGDYALQQIQDGDLNSAFGYKALTSNDAGDCNSAFGCLALISNTGGDYSSAFGYKALTSSTGGSNTAVGYKALTSNTSGIKNVAVGFEAGKLCTEGWDNIFLGWQAGDNVTTGSNNVIIGSGLDADSATGDDQLNIMGLIKGNGMNGTITLTGAVTFAGTINGTEIVYAAGQNLGIGANAFEDRTTGQQNSSFGDNTLSDITEGMFNSAFGWATLPINTEGDQNSAFGRTAMLYNTTGSDNCAFGYNSLNVNETGINNSAFGSQALPSNIGGSNTAVGYKALLNNIGGNDNTAIGREAGYNITSGSTNICIGYAVGAVSATASNQLNIGNTIYGDLSGGGISIGVTSPNASALLDLTSTTKGFLPPRMTSTQREAISSPPVGLIVFDTSEDEGDGALYVYCGGGWDMLT